MAIAIKKSHEGRFTSWCKRQGYGGVTQQCIARGLKSKSASVRRQANFARNARRWKK